jgi:hypothetical protein
VRAEYINEDDGSSRPTAEIKKFGWKQNGPILRGQICARKKSGVRQVSRRKYRISLFKKLGGTSAEEEAPHYQDRPLDLEA